MLKKVQKKKTATFKIKIVKDKCKGCGLCLIYCPVRCLSFSVDLNKKGVKFVQANKEKECIGCGNCFLICPDACIEIYEKRKS